jgi:hypothetical protein
MTRMSSGSALRVLVGVVHNHNPDRLQKIRDTASLVAENFSQAGMHAEVTEAHYAPDLSGPETLSDVIALLATDWVRAVLLRRLDRPKRIGRLLRRIARALAIWAKRGQRDRELSVKRSIAGKHLHLMETALNSGVDFLMVLEDDAMLNERGNQDFGALIPSIVEHLGPNEGWYLNLGGNSDEQLIAPLLPFAEPYLPGFVRLSPGQVDTVCAFIISRAALEQIWKTVLFRPEIRASLPDQLMNYMMTKKSIDCLHASPSLFIHGSASSLGSWH